MVTPTVLKFEVRPRTPCRHARTGRRPRRARSNPAAAADRGIARALERADAYGIPRALPPRFARRPFPFRSASHDSRPPKRTQAFPDRSLSVILFKNVTNADEVHRALLDRSLQPEMALVDPAPMHSLFALHAAAHKVVVDDARGVLTTRTVHSELVYNLSANKHITEGLRRFGMAGDASAVLACRFDATDADVAAMSKVVAGDAVPARDLETELATLGDFARVKKYYKPGDLECKQGVGTVEDAIVQRIGTRDVL